MNETATLSAEEGDVLSVLDVVLGRAGRVTEAVGLPASNGLRARGARRIATATLAYLVDRGGWRVRTVLRGHRRETGRAWDASLAEGFELRFTSAPIAFWSGLAAALPGLRGTDSRRARRLTRDLIDAETPVAGAVGDWVFFALAADSVERLAIEPDGALALRRRCVAVSPLAALNHPDLAPEGEALRASVAFLLAPGAVRALECTLERVSLAWARAVASSFMASSTLDKRIASASSLARVVGTYLAGLDAVGRYDLAGPAIRLTSTLLETLMPRGAEAMLRALGSAPGVTTVEDRRRACDAAAALASVGARLLQARAALAAEGYGDDRYAEAQVFLRDHGDFLESSREAIGACARALAGVIG